MTAVIFLLDNSPLMGQRQIMDGVQTSYLDVAKNAVQLFIKYRTQSNYADRYMLLTFDRPPHNVKTGWKGTMGQFFHELKNIQCTGEETTRTAIAHAFELLNVQRMKRALETYGSGRYPYINLPAAIVLITNGLNRRYLKQCCYSATRMGELTKDVFRWDQRMFALFLRTAGHDVQDPDTAISLPHGSSPIVEMCHMTAGKSFEIFSRTTLERTIRYLSQNLKVGFLVDFRIWTSSAETNNNGEPQRENDGVKNRKQSFLRTLLHFNENYPPSNCHWPIPEKYWPHPELTILPPRSAVPKVNILASVPEPRCHAYFPVDVYEMDEKHFGRFQPSLQPNEVLPLHISNATYNQLPFGYLKLHPTKATVNLHLLPYNYPELVALMDQFTELRDEQMTQELIQKFHSYSSTVPLYYVPILNQVLNFTPHYQSWTPSLPYNCHLHPEVLQNLSQLQLSAKQRCLSLNMDAHPPKSILHAKERVKMDGHLHTSYLIKNHARVLQGHKISHVSNSVLVPSVERKGVVKTYRNLFSIPRRDLILEARNMRDIFYGPRNQENGLQMGNSGHSLPIADMGSRYANGQLLPNKSFRYTGDVMWKRF